MMPCLVFVLFSVCEKQKCSFVSNEMVTITNPMWFWSVPVTNLLLFSVSLVNSVDSDQRQHVQTFVGEVF